KEILEQCESHFLVDEVASVAEALAFLRRDPPFASRPCPNLALFDFELDNRADSGVLLQFIRQSHELMRLPVMVMSQRDHAAESLAGGADRFLLKPSNLKKLKSAILSFWREASMRRPTVLLIEDNQVDVRIIGEFLQDEFDVRCASSPGAGMAELQRGGV